MIRNNFNKDIKTFSYFFLLSFFCFLISFCSNTGPQSGSLSGTINLEGQSDHSGIIIGIYELAELDPDIVEANTNWPHIGIIINQHTEFDHRFGTLVKTGETDASGYFEIRNIPTGSYNVVAIKDGYGFRYIYEISISGGENEISNAKLLMLNNQLNVETESKSKTQNSSLDSKNQTDKPDLTLFPETIISEDITEATTFESYHHYIIEQDINIADELTIEPGVVTRLNGGKEITNYGTFNAVGEYGNFIWFTKNDGFSENLSSIEPDSNYIWDKITLESASQAQIKCCKFDWATIGLLNHENGFNISDCIFRNSQCGFEVSSVDSTFCSNLFCENITNNSYAGIYYVDTGSGNIEKNIVHNCEEGITTKDDSDPILQNNYVSNSNIGIETSFHSSPLIKNNEIKNCRLGVNIETWSTPEIKNNNILNSETCVYKDEFTHTDTEYKFHYNNFSSSEYVISLQFSLTWGTTYTVDATDNYFFSIDDSQIQNLIYDKHDVEEQYQDYIGEVFYNPFLIQEYPYAGIQ